MRFIQPGLCALLLAAGGGWAAWLVRGHTGRKKRPPPASARPSERRCSPTSPATGRTPSCGSASGSTAARWRWPAPRSGPGWCGRSSMRPPSGPSRTGSGRWTGSPWRWWSCRRRPSPMLCILWFEVAVATFRHLGSGDRRRRAESDLHGHASLLGRRFLRRLAKRNGILLGQWGAGRKAPLIGWSLEGSAITVAPPRTGKGALIALNLLSPDGRGFEGSTVTIDPRGELWCIAARRRRELGPRCRAPRSLRRDEGPQGTRSGNATCRT